MYFSRFKKISPVPKKIKEKNYISDGNCIKDIEKKIQTEINNQCVECGKKNPEYISINNGIFLCKNCIQSHFQLPQEVSTIIKNDLKILTLNEINFIYNGGNKKLLSYIKNEFPLLKEFPPEFLYRTKAMDFYRKHLNYLVFGGLKPTKPSVKNAYEIIDYNSNHFIGKNNVLYKKHNLTPKKIIINSNNSNTVMKCFNVTDKRRNKIFNVYSKPKNITNSSYIKKRIEYRNTDCNFYNKNNNCFSLERDISNSYSYCNNFQRTANNIDLNFYLKKDYNKTSNPYINIKKYNSQILNYNNNINNNKRKKFVEFNSSNNFRNTYNNHFYGKKYFERNSKEIDINKSDILNSNQLISLFFDVGNFPLKINFNFNLNEKKNKDDKIQRPIIEIKKEEDIKDEEKNERKKENRNYNHLDNNSMNKKYIKTSNNKIQNINNKINNINKININKLNNSKLIYCKNNSRSKNKKSEEKVKSSKDNHNGKNKINVFINKENKYNKNDYKYNRDKKDNKTYITKTKDYNRYNKNKENKDNEDNNEDNKEFNKSDSIKANFQCSIRKKYKLKFGMD